MAENGIPCVGIGPHTEAFDDSVGVRVLVGLVGDLTEAGGGVGREGGRTHAPAGGPGG